MTRKEQIIEINQLRNIIDKVAQEINDEYFHDDDVSGGYIEDPGARWSRSLYQIEDKLRLLADEILALPLDVPGDDEIEIKYSPSLPVLCCLHDIPIRFDAKQGEYLSIMRDNNYLKQRGAKWMRSEILKRNTP